MTDYENRRLDFIRRLNLPQDVFAGATLISTVGVHEITIENYKALVSYTDKEVVLQGKKELIRISGERLEVCYFTNTDMKIFGHIHTISYS